MTAQYDHPGALMRGALFLLATLILLWPAALNGQPLLLDDSGSYLRGGGVGFTAATAMISEWFASLVPSSAPSDPVTNADSAAIASSAIAGSGGARSIVYSLASYLLRAPGNSMLVLVVAQAACVAYLVVKTQYVMAPYSATPIRFVAVAVIAVTTSAAWYASTAMPDIFAGILILAIMVLTLHPERLSMRSRIVLVAMIAVAITVHASHLLIALGMIVLGILANRVMARGRPWRGIRQTAWLAAPLLLGVGILLASSFVGFGKASLAPKRYPITLARSVNDGPGLWHLQKHCVTERYAVCEVFSGEIPRGIDQFLWGPNGLRMRATPDQMERIRAEEMIIVQRASLEYPMTQIWRAAANLGDQLWSMGLSGLRFGNVLIPSADGRLKMVPGRPDWPALRNGSEMLIYLSFFASLLVIGACRKQLTRVEIGAIGLIVSGLILNAGVCGILSAVTDRYQGRAAWVLPVVTLAILLRLYASDGRENTSRQRT